MIIFPRYFTAAHLHKRFAQQINAKNVQSTKNYTNKQNLQKYKNQFSQKREHFSIISYA
jgi:hypothetical protein